MTRLRTHFVVVASFTALLGVLPVSAQTIYWKADHIRDASGAEIAVATPLPGDTTAPTTPGTPSATSTTTTSVALSWSGSTDASGVVGYAVYRGSVPVGAVTGTSFTDVGLLPNTAYAYRVVAFDAAHNYSSFSSTLSASTNAPSGVPRNLTATATSTSTVSLTWSAPSSGSVDHYGVYRRSSGGWSKLTTTTGTSYSDTTVSAGTAYLYKISGENSSNVVQGYTNQDLATTVLFTDDTITVHSTVIKAAHVTELRTAINAVRTAAGLATASWTNTSLSGAWIKVVDISELRSALGEAIALLGLPAANYTDTSLYGVLVKKAHTDELRQRVK